MTAKLQKIWRTEIGTFLSSKDAIEILTKDGEQVEQGYFITAEQLRDELESFFICGYNMPDRADTLEEFRKLIKDRFKELGVDDD